VIALRPFEAGDLVEAYRLDRICFPAGIAYSKWELRHFLSRPFAFARIAEDGDAPHSGVAGFLVAGQDARRRKGPAHVVTIDIAPAYRRRGVGTLLMDAMEEHFRSLGCSSIRLEVAVDNDAAIAFYNRRGFAATQLLPGYYKGRLDALAMSKSIEVPIESELGP
jgi:ribosomal-protein-alanine N-acetyltransferase